LTSPFAGRSFPGPIGNTVAYNQSIYARGGGEMSLGTIAMSPTLNVAAGETTLVKIENATFNEPTDMDILVGKIRFAYRTMAS
jgi:hypothetical protein